MFSQAQALDIQVLRTIFNIYVDMMLMSQSSPQQKEKSLGPLVMEGFPPRYSTSDQVADGQIPQDVIGYAPRLLGSPTPPILIVF